MVRKIILSVKINLDLYLNFYFHRLLNNEKEKEKE